MKDGVAILIVEDDLILKNLLTQELSGKYALSFAMDGEEALTLFESVKPDLVLLDLVIPKLSGFEVLEHIRARNDELRGTPVVVLSNLSQDSDRTRAMQAGANRYLVKAEVSIEEIVAQINRCLPPPSKPSA